MSYQHAQSLVHRINADHGVAFRLVGRCIGGTHGAYEIVDRSGQRAILKFGTAPAWLSQVRRSVPLLDHLGATGYPAPRLLLHGSTDDGTDYTVQEFVPGGPMGALTPDNFALLLVLNDRQANLAPATDQDSSAYVRRVVFAGESGCE